MNIPSYCASWGLNNCFPNTIFFMDPFIILPNKMYNEWHFVVFHWGSSAHTEVTSEPRGLVLVTTANVCVSIHHTWTWCEIHIEKFFSHLKSIWCSSRKLVVPTLKNMLVNFTTTDKGIVSNTLKKKKNTKAEIVFSWTTYANDFFAFTTFKKIIHI